MGRCDGDARRAADSRSDQFATLKGLAHELLTAPDTRERVAQADQDSDQLLVAATGRPLTAEVFRTYLRERYLGH